MNSRRFLLTALLALAAIPCAQAATDEDNLLALIQSDKPVGERAAACRRLKPIGTVKSVPALAALLTDEELSHSARYALETMPFPEAGAALRAALDKATGKTKAGIIDSLGERRDKEALPALTKLVGDADPLVASSAAVALGRIGGTEAVEALRATAGLSSRAPNTVGQADRGTTFRLAVADALLLCAEQLLAAGDKKAASAIYQEATDPKEKPHVRVAGFRGLILAAGDQAPSAVGTALTGTDRAAQMAALQLARDIPGQEATKAFAALLNGGKLTPKNQVALIEALNQRGDPAAASAILAICATAGLSSREPGTVGQADRGTAVRIAALQTLGTLGDASAVPVLADSAIAKGAEQEAARDSLLRLKGAPIREAILAYLPNAAPDVQMELVRALGARRDAQAVPALLKMLETQGENSPARLALIRSLGMLSDEKSIGVLIGLLVQAKADAEREEAEKAMVSICGRAKRPETCAPAILAAMKGADVQTRCSLLRVAGRAGGPDALKELRAAVGDKEPAIQDAAIRTLADAGGIDAAPDLLQVAKEAPNAAHRVLALRGYWRLVGLAGDRPTEERLKMCETGLAAAQRPDEKKLGMAELAKVSSLAALQLAESLSKDQAIQAEAETASVRIAAALGGSNPAESKAALRRIMAATKNADVRTEAGKALDGMDRFVGFITTWSYAGPYRIPGKECSELFGIPAGPEKQGEKVAWKPLAPPADPSLFWQADLSNLTGGDHCLMYLETRVFSPKEQRVRLEIGTDDGVKLWINGTLVHSNNAIRGLKAGDDRAQATLKEGWNDFFVKISQHTLGCGACIRIRAADGSTIEGLRFDGGGPAAPAGTR